MDGSLAKLAKYRQIVGMAVAALILTVIFVPFQSAQAFTVEIDLPDSDDDTVTQSPEGESFEITIDVEAGELISISSIELILDNDESSVKRTTFNSNGARTSGSSNLVIGNVLDIDSSSNLDDYGYGYGYGLVSSGTTFNPNYSYSFTYSYAFIGGNSVSYSNAGVTNFVAGLVGPGTITISGTLRTASLAEGTHTLDALIDTGAGGNNVDQLVAPQLSFDVEEGEDLVDVETSVGSGATTATPVTQTVGGVSRTVTLNFNTATTSGGSAAVTLQTPAGFAASKTEAQLAALNLEADGDDIILTDDNGDEFRMAGAISDIDIDLAALGLDPDTDFVTIGLDYDDDGLSLDEELEMRIFHFNDDTDEWEALTNDDPDINDGDEVDTSDDVVYGSTNDFSLFAPAVSSGGGGGGGGGTGGGGGSASKVIVNQTFSPEYFLTHPLSKVQISQSGFTNMDGNTIVGGFVGQQISINASFRNFQETAQPYAIIIQVVDENGFTTDIGWTQGSLERGQSASASRSWTIEETGNYSIKIFVWNGVSAGPIPLSEVGQKNFSVT